jgi:hypothetical protein
MALMVNSTIHQEKLIPVQHKHFEKIKDLILRPAILILLIPLTVENIKRKSENNLSKSLI